MSAVNPALKKKGQQIIQIADGHPWEYRIRGGDYWATPTVNDPIAYLAGGQNEIRLVGENNNKTEDTK